MNQDNNTIPPEYHSLNLLVIDDDEFLLNIIKITLQQLGIDKIDIVTDGAKAIEKITEQPDKYDVVLSDLNMPNMDGIELLRGLDGVGFTGGIILLTAEDLKILKTADTLARAHGLYLLGVLEKPIDKNKLITLLNSYQFITSRKDTRNTLEFSKSEIENAIKNKEFTTHFQPQVDMTNCTMLNMEGLARWHHPTHGVIPAGTFISTIENYGLTPDLNNLILEDAIAQVTKLNNSKIKNISLNASMDSLVDVTFPDKLQAIADKYNFSLGNLILEITESQFSSNAAKVLDSLIRLRLKGVTLAIDDFGTGYSNLAQLKHAPVSELKIDRSLLLMGGHDDEGRAILETAIEIGKKLGLKVVVEGVETIHEWNMVRSHGADIVQGYFIAKPMPLTELEEWYEEWLLQEKNICDA